MTDAMILEQRPLSASLHWLTLAAPSLATAQPAQFVMIKPALGERHDPLLRHCAWVVASDKRQNVSVVLDRTTSSGDMLAMLPQGTVLDVLGAYGRPLQLPSAKQTTLLIAQQHAVAALLFYAQRASEQSHPVVLLASGDADQRIPPWVLPPDVEYIATDGDVLDLIDATQKLENPLNWANRLIAAGTPELATRLAERIKRERFRWQPGFATLVLHDHFTCGVGLCGDCWVATRNGEKLACAQGPAFELRDIV